MIDLAPVAGVHAEVDPETGALTLGDELLVEEMTCRTLAAAAQAYADPPAAAAPLYYMANGITPRDRPEPNSELRYELTSLRPGVVGGEWVKTVGHVHDAAPDGVGYPEEYEVVAGSAIFVLFRVDSRVCLLVQAGAGDGFVIPPGWHHLAVNPGSSSMVFADVVARAVVPDYTLLRERRGGPAYLSTDGVEPNPRYPAYRYRWTTADELPAPTSHGRLADAFFGERDALDYLLEPGRFRPAWSKREESFS